MTDEIDEEVRAAAEHVSALWLKQQLESTTTDPDGRVRQDYAQMRAAAHVLLEQSGLLEVMRSLAMDGDLRPPPMWVNGTTADETDMVPVGGGAPKGADPAFLDVHVRTFHKRRGFVYVPLRIVVPWQEAPSPERSVKLQAMLGQAHERGKWQLRKMLNGFASRSR